MRLPLTVGIAAAAALGSAAAQDVGAQDAERREMDDCAFLIRAFEGTYQGIRAEEGKMDEADPALVTMYLQIQSNTLQLAEAAGCDVRPMIEIAREQLSRYEERGAAEPERGRRRPARD